ncbi:TetR/AcrR family transcriptional regulator [Mycobacterium stomatepiae]|uniref:TetR family transcriptional regulator n=1 Tax=Mycobacterium stomatepiae TaxID=470076 RepID=A0A7I7Q2Y7_9MYCO|nr:TetR/AcrR family transcriptional regulator [Mycobacterium stomatepiae]MCV7165894.1 TetR family transcriptional regulator [Mycobacterium stomatepiae]BBY20770.1 TetR family transcriptional regulator [Mycobacterium stomatepiae]
MVEPISRRERKKAQTRRALTKAALDLFLERGFEATTVEEIAEAADFHRATFHRIFASKEDVAMGDILDLFALARERLREALPTDDPFSVARDVLTDTMASFEESDDELVAAHVQVWTSDPALQSRFTAMMLDWEHEIARFFAEAWGLDPESDIRCYVIATAMIGVTRSALLMRRASGLTVRETIDKGFDFLAAAGFGRNATHDADST